VSRRVYPKATYPAGQTVTIAVPRRGEKVAHTVTGTALGWTHGSPLLLDKATGQSRYWPASWVSDVNPPLEALPVECEHDEDERLAEEE
jgi:hypothetical protein